MKVYANKETSVLQNAVGGKGAIALQDNRVQSVFQKSQVAALSAEKSDEAPVQKKANTKGLPDQLKSGIENLSGHSLDDVKVHYNSSQPAQLNAHAYAQGNQIHLAPGQEKHLPHEAWHVVQQKQGRVKPTLQMKEKVNINDDKSLENEADVMGAKALQLKDTSDHKRNLEETVVEKNNKDSLQFVIQRGLNASKPAVSIAKKAVTYAEGQISNTVLKQIMTKEILQGSIVTHGTSKARSVLRGETDQKKKTNPGTTGEYVHFWPGWKNTYGSHVYVFDKSKVPGLIFRNGEYVVSGEVDTGQSLGFYTQKQEKDVTARLIEGKELEKD
ncbi:DUF4157 domain-containing protein [Agrobacterium tumefaciens]|nr:DUF4157 domain-containing protein [Agrobacterium tumefaciens]